jgi:hypothetical protein
VPGVVTLYILPLAAIIISPVSMLRPVGTVIVLVAIETEVPVPGLAVE